MKPDYEEIEIEEFDRLARAGEFKTGPFVSTFGDGYGEPYQPEREVSGVLKDGRKVQSVKKYKPKKG